MITTTVQSNRFFEFADGLEAWMQQVVEKAVYDLYRLAIETSPWDTRHMITTHKPEIDAGGLSGQVAVYADYSLYVHEGHRTSNGGYVAARPWLAEAANVIRPRFNAAVYVVFRRQAA